MAVPAEHRVGGFARLTGLENHQSLDGEVGELVRQTDTGRWVVRLSAGLKAIRPENLTPAAPELPEAARRGLGGAAVATAHLLLELVRSGGHRALSAAMLPASVLVWIIATLLACYRLHRQSVGPDASLPGVSELGLSTPARGVYRGGSAAIALLLACTVRLYSMLLLPHLSESVAAARAAESTNMGYVAALGMAVQGIFTLEVGLSPQTLMHFAGAVAFVLGTVWHADAANELFADLGDSTLALSPAVSAAIALRRLCSEGLPVMLLLVPLCIQTCQWATALEIKGGRLQSTVSAAQWALVLNFGVFYCTYACDFWAVVEAN